MPTLAVLAATTLDRSERNEAEAKETFPGCFFALSIRFRCIRCVMLRVMCVLCGSIEFELKVYARYSYICMANESGISEHDGCA